MLELINTRTRGKMIKLMSLREIMKPRTDSEENRFFMYIILSDGVETSLMDRKKLSGRLFRGVVAIYHCFN